MVGRRLSAEELQSIVGTKEPVWCNVYGVMFLGEIIKRLADSFPPDQSDKFLFYGNEDARPSHSIVFRGQEGNFFVFNNKESEEPVFQLVLFPQS